MSILVTGGAGFIGSHTCVELLNAGYQVVVVDNLYNASEKAVERVKEITGKDLTFYKADIRDKEAMNAIFDKEEIESVIHFAGLKAVGEYYFQLFRNCIRGSGVYSDYRGMSEGNMYESVWMDEMDAGADSDRSAHGGSGVECGASAIL